MFLILAEVWAAACFFAVIRAPEDRFLLVVVVGNAGGILWRLLSVIEAALTARQSGPEYALKRYNHPGLYRERFDCGAMRLQGLRQRVAETAGDAVDNPGAGNLAGRRARRRCAVGAGAWSGLVRQVEAGRVGAVHHVDVVIAWEARSASPASGRGMAPGRRRIPPIPPKRDRSGLPRSGSRRAAVRLYRPIAPGPAAACSSLARDLPLSTRKPYRSPTVWMSDECATRHDRPPRGGAFEGTQVARLRHGRVGHAPDERRRRNSRQRSPRRSPARS